MNQVCYNKHYFFFRQVLDNGTLVLLPFPAMQYRPDVHATVYRCRAHNAHGAIVSRDMRTQAGMCYTRSLNMLDMSHLYQLDPTVTDNMSGLVMSKCLQQL